MEMEQTVGFILSYFRSIIPLAIPVKIVPTGGADPMTVSSSEMLGRNSPQRFSHSVLKGKQNLHGRVLCRPRVFFFFF